MIRYLLEKEFKQIRRDKFLPRIIFVIPILQLIILPFAANFEMRNINLSIVNQDHSVLATQLEEKILSSGYFRLTDRSDTYAQAMTAIEANKADVIVEIPPHFERDLAKEGTADVHISANAVNGTKGGLAVSYLHNILQAFNTEKGFHPHTDKYIPQNKDTYREQRQGITSIQLYNPHQSYKVFMVPAINGLIYLFAAVYLIAFTGFGLAISSISTTQQQAMLTAFFIMIIFVLLSGLFTPISSMPLWAQKITLFNPIRYFIEVIRMIYLKGSTFIDLQGHFVITCLFAVFFNVLAVISYRKQS